MRQKLYTMFFCVFSLAFVATDCKHNPVGPEIIQPGRRDYTWTFDTLHLQQGYLQSIWGSSPTDIWACGYDDLFHYDGTKWTKWNGYTGWSNKTIFGLSQNDIWLSGNGAQLWHFDGTTWTQKFTFKPNDSSDAYIWYLQGTSNKNLYAVGYVLVNNNFSTRYSFILHYDGSTWSEIYHTSFTSAFNEIKIDDGEEEYISAYTPPLNTTVDSLSFYRLINNNIKLLYTNSLDSIKGGMNRIGNKVYFVISHDVYRYESFDGILGRFVKKFSFPEEDFRYQVYGRNEEDIFIPIGAGISHYNGMDTQQLVAFPNANVSIVGGEPALFDHDVFFCVSDDANGVNMILHGKLKQEEDISTKK